MKSKLLAFTWMTAFTVIFGKNTPTSTDKTHSMKMISRMLEAMGLSGNVRRLFSLTSQTDSCRLSRWGSRRPMLAKWDSETRGHLIMISVFRLPGVSHPVSEAIRPNHISSLFAFDKTWSRWLGHIDSAFDGSSGEVHAQVPKIDAASKIQEAPSAQDCIPNTFAWMSCSLPRNSGYCYL